MNCRETGDRVILHLHIPRTAGTSLSKWLRSQFPQEVIYHYSTPSAFLLYCEEHSSHLSDLRLVTGHFRYGIHDAIGNPDYLYVIVLRNPIQRIVSLFSYIAGNPQHCLHSVLQESNASIASFYSKSLHLSPQFSDGQVRQLAGNENNGLTRKHLEAAINVLEDPRTVSGVLEDLSLLREDLAQYASLPSVKGFPCTNRCETTVEPTEEDVEAIMKHNRLDLELYEHIQRLSGTASAVEAENTTDSCPPGPVPD